MAVSKKSSKAKSRKSQSGGGGGNLHKHFESERISDDIAAFEKAGGKVEKLGVTRVLQKITPATPGATPAAKTGETTPDKRPASTGKR